MPAREKHDQCPSFIVVLASATKELSLPIRTSPNELVPLQMFEEGPAR